MFILGSVRERELIKKTYSILLKSSLTFFTIVIDFVSILKTSNLVNSNHVVEPLSFSWVQKRCKEET